MHSTLQPVYFLPPSLFLSIGQQLKLADRLRAASLNVFFKVCATTQVHKLHVLTSRLQTLTHAIFYWTVITADATGSAHISSSFCKRSRLFLSPRLQPSYLFWQLVSGRRISCVCVCASHAYPPPHFKTHTHTSFRPAQGSPVCIINEAC